MDAYTIMIIALGAGIIFMGAMLVKRIRALKSLPDEDKMRESSDVERLLQKHFAEQENKSDTPDEEQKTP